MKKKFKESKNFYREPAPSADAQTKQEVEQSIAMALTQGFIKIVGHDAKGNPQFSLTAKGEARVDALIKASKGDNGDY